MADAYSRPRLIRFTPGRPLAKQLTAGRLNEMLDAIDANRVQFGDNIMGTHTTGGSIVRTKGVEGRGIVKFPWRTSVIGNSSTGFKVKVLPGTIDELVPSNIFGEFDIDEDGLFYVKAKCETNGKLPNAITIVVDDVANDPEDMATEETAPPLFNVVLAMVKDHKVYQVRTRNLLAVPVVLFTQDRLPASPGQEPFKRWWGWKVVESDYNTSI